MRDENPICTLGDYFKPSNEGYRNTIELLIGNNVSWRLWWRRGGEGGVGDGVTWWRGGGYGWSLAGIRLKSGRKRWGRRNLREGRERRLSEPNAPLVLLKTKRTLLVYTAAVGGGEGNGDDGEMMTRVVVTRWRCGGGGYYGDGSRGGCGAKVEMWWWSRRERWRRGGEGGVGDGVTWWRGNGYGRSLAGIRPKSGQKRWGSQNLRGGPSPQPQALNTTFEARVRDYMAAHTERMERFENTIFKQREEFNSRMTEMFGLLKELMTSKTPERVLIREETKFPITKNINYIFLTKREEGGSDRTEVTPDNAERPTETKIKMPVMEVEKINEVENGARTKSIKTSESEEAVEAPGFQPVAYYLKHKINEKLIMPQRGGGGLSAVHSQPRRRQRLERLMPLLWCRQWWLALVVAVDDDGGGCSGGAGYFVILDFKENENRPFILGTPLLTTAKASIKFDTGTITLRSGKHKVKDKWLGNALSLNDKGMQHDPEIPAGQAQTVIPHNVAFQTKDLDTYDSECDDLSTAQAVLIANISNYGFDVISDVPNSETYLNDIDNQILKNESKEKENKYMENEIDLKKKIKELDNIICKADQSAQTVHMLTKPQAFFDNTHKQALGYQNPFYLKKA
nr:hypothetical protein [Tanacetum cinerariifolium]